MNDHRVVILAAGEGSRLRTDAPKPLTLLQGQPFLRHVVEAFAPVVGVENVSVVAPKSADGSDAWRLASAGARLVPQSFKGGVLDSAAFGLHDITLASGEILWLVWADMIGWRATDVEMLTQWTAAIKNQYMPNYHAFLPVAASMRPYIPLRMDVLGMVSGVRGVPTAPLVPAVVDCGVFGFSSLGLALFKAHVNREKLHRDDWWRCYGKFINEPENSYTLHTIPMPSRCAVSVNTREDFAYAVATL